MRKHVLILGAGFGGLELATRLSTSLADEVHTTLVDRADAFVFGFSKLDVMFGRRTPDEVRIPYRDLNKPGVEFRQELVTSIDASTRRVVTDAATYEPDVLVVALGADYDPAATPGFARGGHEYYSVPGAERMREVLASFESGVALIAILGTPFKCPPAPFEGAFLLHDHLVGRGVRDAVQIRMLSPMDSPIPVSPETSAAITSGLAERGIEVRFGELVTSIDPTGRTAQLRSGEQVPYDLFIGIPRHTVPDVVEASGLTAGGTDGWVRVDKRTLLTPHPGVYAIGDVCDAPVPRAGVFAETAARAVADDIAARLRGGSLEVPYDGRGSCYIEFGGGRVGKVEADFLSGPAPTAPFTPPSRELAQEKERFATSRRIRWFGAGA